jgi:CHRD domain
VGTLRIKLAVVVAVVGAIAVAAVAIAHDRGAFKTRLSGFEEVPVVITDGNGRFEARIARGAQEIQWTLRYADLNADATQAHIHVGQELANGGIAVWLCGNPTAGPPPITPPAGTQTCPARSAELSGTITPAEVVGPAGQGVQPGAFDTFVRALRAGVTYANVHTTQSPGGEIRGQIRDGGAHR